MPTPLGAGRRGLAVRTAGAALAASLATVVVAGLPATPTALRAIGAQPADTGWDSVAR